MKWFPMLLEEEESGGMAAKSGCKFSIGVNMKDEASVTPDILIVLRVKKNTPVCTPLDTSKAFCEVKPLEGRGHQVCGASRLDRSHPAVNQGTYGEALKFPGAASILIGTPSGAIRDKKKKSTDNQKIQEDAVQTIPPASGKNQFSNVMMDN
ncbi:hypothetical protein E2C01_020554 [Portunus trituberculatus]|uniref:Uncharacterized protein n=1 Tax=Portunus trituberculatus TaxID=210409 RepID=A0A5B7E3P8_PORTR|nr:hypothetical protein [Portunus trituberculatus]